MHNPDLQRLYRQIERHEGRKRLPYLCPAGKWTVGVGRNLETNPPTLDELLVMIADGVGPDAIDLMLAHDVAESESDMVALFPSFKGWPPARQAALIEMRFNIGLSRLLGFKRMILHLREGRWPEAAQEALDSQWAIQVGEGRSKTIAKEISTGEWVL